MNFRMPRLICILAIAVLAVAGSAGAVFAADDVGPNIGTGPESAAAPLKDWVTLDNGTKHWYAFTDGGDENDVEVRMDLSQDDWALFEIWTSEQLRTWQNGDEFDPVGAGTANENLNDDLYWTGNFVASNTYYVVVNSRNFGSVDYQLTVNGKDVGFPSALVTNEATSDEMASDEMASDEMASDEMASDEMASDEATSEEIAASPGDDIEILEESAGLVVEGAAIDEVIAGSHAGVALAPMGETRSVAPGETHWYAFRDEGDEESIQAILDASPNISVEFEVWTADQLHLWQNGDEFDPVGAGTENKEAEIDQFWTGSFVRSGDYYVVVRHTGLVDGGGEYSLTVTGADVSY